MSITDFLNARIAEDEELARAAYYEGQKWYPEEEFVGRMPECCDCGCEVMMGANRKIEAQHIARHDPARVLAECAAKRAIVELADDANSLDISVDNDRRVGWRDEAVEPYCGDSILYALAAVYADHPEYRAEWRVRA